MTKRVRENNGKERLGAMRISSWPFAACEGLREDSKGLIVTSAAAILLLVKQEAERSI